MTSVPGILKVPYSQRASTTFVSVHGYLDDIIMGPHLLTRNFYLLYRSVLLKVAVNNRIYRNTANSRK